MPFWSPYSLVLTGLSHEAMGMLGAGLPKRRLEPWVCPCLHWRQSWPHILPWIWYSHPWVSTEERSEEGRMWWHISLVQSQYRSAKHFISSLIVHIQSRTSLVALACFHCPSWLALLSPPLSPALVTKPQIEWVLTAEPLAGGVVWQDVQPS